MPEKDTKNKEINIRKKAVGAIVLILILSVPICAVLYFLGRNHSMQREAELEQMNRKVLSDISGYANRQYLEAAESFDEHLRKEIDLIVCFLKEYVKAGVYTGPEVFSDGFVVRFDNSGAVFPAQISGDISLAEQNLIEESIRSGQMRTGSIDMDLVHADDAAGEESVWADDVEGSETVRDLSFGKISEDTFYVHITFREEYNQFVELYKQNNLSAMQTAAEISGGMTAIMTEESGQISTIEQFGDWSEGEDVQGFGLTVRDLEEQSSGTLKVNGHRYRYLISKEEGEWLGYDHVYIIQVYMMDGMIHQLIQLSVMVCLLMIIFYITIVTYALSEEEYTLKKILDSSEAERYNPRRLRRKLCNAAVISAVIILALSLLTQSVIQMRQQTLHGKHTLQLLSGQLGRGSEELDEAVRGIRETWYLQLGHEISAFLTEFPEAQTEEKLRECCEITGADFIMLFDHEGNEILCSSDYDGFTMFNGLGENSSDFKRLLLGIPEIVHPVSVDRTTGLERQMIGVTLDLSGNEAKHGALIMALLPGTTGTSEASESDGEVSLLVPGGVICFEAMQSTGEILYAEDPSMRGKTVEDIGLTSGSLQDGYMDFGTILGVHRLILTHADEKNVFYYAEDDSFLRIENLRFGLIAALLYTLVLIVIVRSLLREYNENNYRKWVIFASEMKRDSSGPESAEQNSALQAKMSSRMNRLKHRSSGKSNAVMKFFIRISGWNSKMPEKRASTVFMLGLFVLLQLWVVLVPGGYLMHGTGTTLLDFLLHGDWMRGFNLFALYSILVCLAIADLIILGSGWFLQILADCLGPKGQTICRLLQSIIKFVTIAAVVFMALSYVGLLNSRVLASMGIGSLAISLGAKDMIADVLSGIMIVFNETVRVGDVVEYQGMVATVRAVRIQSTQLVTLPENDLMTVRNQDVVNIINKSRTASVYKLELKVHTDVSLEKIEEMMKEALPKMREACPGIIGTPNYLGVVAMRSNKRHGTRPLMTLEVDALCDLKDKLSVMVYMNSEMHRLFAEEGIEVY